MTTHAARWRLLAAVGLPAVAWAQAPDVFELSLEQLMDVKVTVASKYEQTVAEAPAVVSVITRDRIRALGVDTLAELLNYVPGFYVALDSGAALKMPVVSARGQHNAHILVLVDGQPVNDQMNASPFILSKGIDLHNVERVEVMRGPGSYLYGTAAFVGIVNVVTRTEGNEVAVEIGSHQARHTAFTLGSKGDAGYVSLSGHYYEDDGAHYTGVFDQYGLVDETRDPWRHYSLQLKGEFRRFGFNLRHSAQRQEQFYNFGFLGNDDNFEDTDSTSLWLYYSPRLGSATHGRIGAGYREYNAVALGRILPAAVSPFPADFLAGPYVTHEILSAEARFDTRWGDGHRLSWGADWQQADTPDAYNFCNYAKCDPTMPYLGEVTVLDGERFLDDERRRVSGVYLQDQFDRGTWTLAYGARYDDFSDIGDNVSPNLAFTFRRAPGEQIKAVYGQAFQAPAMARLYNKDNPNTVGNRDLEPELIESVAVEYLRYGADTSLSTTLFANRTDDMIYRVALPSGLDQYQNVGEQSSVGVELAGNWRLGEDWELGITWTELLHNDFDANGTISDGTNPLDFVADRYGSIVLNYAVGRWNLNLNGWLRDDVAALPEQGAFAVFNGIARYRARADVELYVEAENLFDRDYDSPSVSGGLGTTATGEVVRATPNRARQLYAGVEVRF